MTRAAAYLAPWLGLTRRFVGGDHWVEHERHVDRPEPPASATPEPERQATVDGVGPLYERHYAVHIRGSRLGPHELITDLATHVNDYAPTQYAWFRSDDDVDHITSGSRWTVELPGPWSGPVDASLVEPGRLRLETRTGHLEAGWIEFSATDGADGTVRFGITSRARSGDGLFDVVYRAGPGRLLQTDMWTRVLEAGVRRSGGRQLGRIRVLTVVHDGDGDATEG